MTRVGYVRLLACLQAIYAELEWALEWNRRHPAVGPLCLPELWRNELLQDDLGALLGPSWHARAPRQEAAPYVERLGLLCDEAPERLAAHVWVLYTQELPGLASLRAQVEEGLGLRGKEGTAFLRHVTRFDGAVGRAWVLEAMERLPLDGASRAALADEARLALHGIRDLFAAIERSWEGPPLAPLRGRC